MANKLIWRADYFDKATDKRPSRSEWIAAIADEEAREEAMVQMGGAMRVRLIMTNGEGTEAANEDFAQGQDEIFEEEFAKAVRATKSIDSGLRTKERRSPHVWDIVALSDAKELTFSHLYY